LAQLAHNWLKNDSKRENPRLCPTLRMQAHWLVAQSIAHPKPSNKLASPNTRTDENKTRNGNKAIYASRGIHRILRVLYFPKPCFQADKSTAGLKPRPGAYSRDVACNSKMKTPQKIIMI